MSSMQHEPFRAIPEGMRWCPHCNGYGSSLKEASGRCSRWGSSGLVWQERQRPVAPPNGQSSR